MSTTVADAKGNIENLYANLAEIQAEIASIYQKITSASKDSNEIVPLTLELGVKLLASEEIQQQIYQAEEEATKSEKEANQAALKLSIDNAAAEPRIEETITKLFDGLDGLGGDAKGIANTMGFKNVEDFEKASTTEVLEAISTLEPEKAEEINNILQSNIKAIDEKLNTLKGTNGETGKTTERLLQDIKQVAVKGQEAFEKIQNRNTEGTEEQQVSQFKAGMSQLKSLKDLEEFTQLQTTICKDNSINPKDIKPHHLVATRESFRKTIAGWESMQNLSKDSGVISAIQEQKEKLIEAAQRQSWYQEFLAKQEKERQEQAEQNHSVINAGLLIGIPLEVVEILNNQAKEQGYRNISTTSDLESFLAKVVDEKTLKNIANKIPNSQLLESIESSLDQPPQPQEPNQAVETRLKETNTKDSVLDAGGGLKGVELQGGQPPGDMPANIPSNVRMPANYAPAPAQQGKTGP